MVKIEHTVFALPFTFMSALLALRGWPSPAQVGWILLAMVGARSAAMAFNRLVDLPFDAQNPRTQGRALPRRLVTKGFVAAFVVAGSAALVFAASQLNRQALLLSPLALAVVLGYSFTKRFTWLSHVVLGVALGAAPVGAWVALRGDVAAAPLVLGLAVVLWVAGFDIIYSCQDVEFDRKVALHSIPERFGTAVALRVSAFFHLLMLLILGILFWKEHLGTISYLGLVAVGLLIAYEHRLVRPGDLSRADTAFFTVNGWISVLLFMTTMIDLLWSGPG
jgi:4-hydroxybenzoate polyprenyltransferase